MEKAFRSGPLCFISSSENEFVVTIVPGVIFYQNKQGIYFFKDHHETQYPSRQPWIYDFAAYNFW